jgi:hypothetical protein
MRRPAENTASSRSVFRVMEHMLDGIWLLAEHRRAMPHRDAALAARLRDCVQTARARHAPGTPRAGVWLAREVGTVPRVADVDLVFETLPAATSLLLAAGNATRCVGEFEPWCREFVATVRSRDCDVLDA